MAILKPGSSYNRDKFVNSPKDTKDSYGKPGMGSMSRAPRKKNNIKTERPNSGDNSSFKKIGTKMDI